MSTPWYLYTVTQKLGMNDSENSFCSNPRLLTFNLFLFISSITNSIVLNVLLSLIF